MKVDFITPIPDKAADETGWSVESYGYGRNGIIMKNLRMGLSMIYGLVLKNGENSHCQPYIRVKVPSAVIVPVVGSFKKPEIGFLKERKRVSGTFNEFPRGFGEKKGNRYENPIEIAQRELKEEAGIFIEEDRFEVLSGPFNMDTAFLDYSENKEAGIYVVMCHLKKEEREISCLDFEKLDQIDFGCGISQLAKSIFQNYLK